MKRLNTLRIERFRQLGELRLGGLGDVNLIVGGNNSGKSTLLDALRLFAAKGAPSLIEQLLMEHGELGFSPGESSELTYDRSISNLFQGRQFPSRDGQPIYIGEIDQSKFVQIEHVFMREEFEERDVQGELTAVRRLKRVDKFSDEDIADVMEALELTSSEGAGMIGPIPRTTAFPLSTFFSPRRINSRSRFEESVQPIPCSFVASKFTSTGDLAEAWDEVVLTEGERYALDALKLIDDQTEGLAFVQIARSRTRLGSVPGRSDERSAVLRLKSTASPVPLQSMGDGMTRVLQLILAAFRGKGGFLLIDEFENGLHFSVQVQVWKLLFLLAKENAIQIFATTHSLDCVRAFAHVATQSSLKGVLLRLEKSGRESVAAEINEDSLKDLVDSMIEVR